MDDPHAMLELLGYAVGGAGLVMVFAMALAGAAHMLTKATLDWFHRPRKP